MHLEETFVPIEQQQDISSEQLLNNIQQYQEDFNNLIIVLKGRKVDEKSAVVIQNGQFKGYCFYDLNYQILNQNVLDNVLTSLTHVKDSMSIIKHYLYQKNDYRVIRF